MKFRPKSLGIMHAGFLENLFDIFGVETIEEFLDGFLLFGRRGLKSTVLAQSKYLLGVE